MKSKHGIVNAIRRKWKRFNSCDSDSVALSTAIKTLLLGCYSDVSDLTIRLTTPSDSVALTTPITALLFGFFLGRKHSYDSAYESDCDVSESKP